WNSSPCASDWSRARHHVARAVADFLAYIQSGARLCIIASKQTPGWQAIRESPRCSHSTGVAQVSDMRRCNQTGCIRAYDSVLRRADLRLLVHRVHIKNSRFGILFDKDYLWIEPLYYSDSILSKRSQSHRQLLRSRLCDKFKQRLLQQICAAAGSLHQLDILRRDAADISKCSNTTGLFWPDGKRFSGWPSTAPTATSAANERQTRVHRAFDRRGLLNTTEFVAAEPRAKQSVRTPPYWPPGLGRWAMSSQRTSLWRHLIRLQGVHLAPPGQPGASGGRPKKFRLRAATTLKRTRSCATGPGSAPDSARPGDPRPTLVSLPCRVLAEMPACPTGYNLPAQLGTTSRRACPSNTASSAPVWPSICFEADKDPELRLDLFEVPDKEVGRLDGKLNNEWNGLVRVLLEGQADMVVTSLKITPNRIVNRSSSACPFIEPAFITILEVALREGAISSTKAFLKPYDYPSWCLILVFSQSRLAHAAALPCSCSSGSVRKASIKATCRPGRHKFSLFRSLWLIWSMLFGAAATSGPYSRLVFLASYTANLAAFHMIAEESYYDLSGINDWRLRDPTSIDRRSVSPTVPSGATEENMRMNYPDIANHMRNYSKSNIDEGIRTFENFYRVGNDEDCKLKTVGNWYSMTGYGIGLPKGSKWRHRINHRILSYRSSEKPQLPQACWSAWSKYWITGACQQSGKLRNTNQTLGVKNFISAFILLIGGMLFCCLLLLLEHSCGQLLSFEQSVNQTVDLIIASQVPKTRSARDASYGNCRSRTVDTTKPNC
uniref:PBPe domain-containing protein n=1 Tax=Macrostomum lignano TaxID=282301 RepID=A0A1I8FSP5_9PLAT